MTYSGNTATHTLPVPANLSGLVTCARARTQVRAGLHTGAVCGGATDEARRCLYGKVPRMHTLNMANVIFQSVHTERGLWDGLWLVGRERAVLLIRALEMFINVTARKAKVSWLSFPVVDFPGSLRLPRGVFTIDLPWPPEEHMLSGAMGVQR